MSLITAIGSVISLVMTVMSWKLLLLISALS